MSELLSVRDLRASYGDVAVLHGINLTVNEGEVVVLLGANGAGKTTTLRAICQMRLVSTSGEIRFEGQPVRGGSPHRLVRRGIAHVPQGRGTFPELTVDENLLIGAYSRRRGDAGADMDRWYQTFPRLAERRKQLAGSMSGGEQQMLAVARAFMSHPKLLLLDEPSLGLSPVLVDALFERLSSISRETGTAMLIVEQNAFLALSIASRGYVLEAGMLAIEGPAEDLRDNDSVRRAYLGV